MTAQPISRARLTRACRCDRCVPNEDFRDGDCRPCWLWYDIGEMGQRYRAHLAKVQLGIEPAAFVAPSAPWPLKIACDRLGPVLDRSNCNCVKKNCHECSLHGRVTVADASSGLPTCVSCSGYVPDQEKTNDALSASPTRNLLYHIYPIRDNGIWQLNVDRLKQRWHVFTGRRVVAIVTDDRTDSPDDVKRAIGDDADYLVMPNKPGRREVETFLPLFERIDWSDRDGITFYAQAKGVTKPNNPGVAVHRWSELLYAACLDYLPLVESWLGVVPCLSAFKKRGGFGGTKARWHFPGSFYWLRNHEVGRRNWREIDAKWWGIETWPAVHFGWEQAHALVKEGVAPSMNLYLFDYIRPEIEPAWEKFQREFAAYRTREAVANAG